MSVKIRLTRTGAKHRPFYRIIVTDSRMPRDGRFIATLGTYDPLTESGNIEVDGELVKHWMSKGATPSLAVKQLLKRAGVVTVEAPAASAKKSPEAVSLEALREGEGEEVEVTPSEIPLETSSGEGAQKPSRAKKAPAKPGKPSGKAASQKEKSKPTSK
ncbi:MAG: 30S ribosomal protein S16 [Candidatus Eisenbacteria bacterium]|nr:30S ribosomal protein S16 [Candidatus Eisenbacteria bacterium]